jgi:hypothetical protein
MVVVEHLHEKPVHCISAVVFVLMYKIMKAITAGFFFHAARKDPHEGCRTLVENQPVISTPAVLFSRDNQTGSSTMSW